MVSNTNGGLNKTWRYYIVGLFGYYIKNHILFNKFFWKNSKTNNSGATSIRYHRIIGQYLTVTNMT